MSHYTVIVIGSNVEEQLAPFQESTEDRSLLSFQDETPSMLEEYENKEIEYIQLADGTIKHTFDEMFKQPDEKSKFSFDRKTVYPKDSKKIKGSLKLMYPTFEVFANEYHGLEKDNETGLYGYWTNPNAQWDWYQIGGRWSGFFKVKKGASGELGETSLVSSTEPKRGWADIVQVKDIDFQGMEVDAAIKANEEYDELEKVLAGRPLPSWKETLELCNGDVEKARVVYHDLETVKDLNKARIFTMGDLKDYYKSSREEFVAEAIQGVCVPFAILNEGQWSERGKMGWFGIATDEKDKDMWNKNVRDLLKSLNPETQLTLVDCHI